MKFNELSIKGAFRIDLEPRRDERGHFVRSFCAREFAAAQLPTQFAQRNHSASKKAGTLRGLHYQVAPHAEDKVVSCVAGKIFDVLVDLRPDSKTYLKWHGEILSPENMMMLFIPKGCAHGFQTLEDNTVVSYLVTEFYNSTAEGGIRWDDPKIGIRWPDHPQRTISERDQKHSLL